MARVDRPKFSLTIVYKSEARKANQTTRYSTEEARDRARRKAEKRKDVERTVWN